MKIRKLSLLVSLAVASAFAMTGCNGYDTDYHGDSVRAEDSHNFLGIVKTAPNSYGYVDDSASIILDTESLWCRRDFSGAKVTLFWGAISVRDY